MKLLFDFSGRELPESLFDEVQEYYAYTFRDDLPYDEQIVAALAAKGLVAADVRAVVLPSRIAAAAAVREAFPAAEVWRMES